MLRIAHAAENVNQQSKFSGAITDSSVKKVNTVDIDGLVAAFIRNMNSNDIEMPVIIGQTTSSFSHSREMVAISNRCAPQTANTFGTNDLI